MRGPVSLLVDRIADHEATAIVHGATLAVAEDLLWATHHNFVLTPWRETHKREKEEKRAKDLVLVLGWQKRKAAEMSGSQSDELLAEYFGTEARKKPCVLVKRNVVLARALDAKRAARGPK